MKVRHELIEHVLVPSKNQPGRFALNHAGGVTLSTGDRIEVLHNRMWVDGAVDYYDTAGSYIFQSDEGWDEALHEGMLIRLPEDPLPEHPF